MGKRNDYGELSLSQLDTIMGDLRKEHRELRFDSVLSTVENPARIREVRRDIARIKTIIREMELGKREKKTIK